MTSSARARRSKKPTDCRRDGKTCETRKQTGREGICTRVTAGCGCCRKETLPRVEVSAVKSLQEGARGRKPFRTFIAHRGVYAVGRAFFASEESFPEQNRFLAVSAPGNPQDFNGNRWGRRRRTPWILRFAKGKIAAAQIGSLRRDARRGRCSPARQLVKNLFLTN